MPDITMCCNYDCPLKEKCYRYRAIPDEYWQSFAMFKPETYSIGIGMITKCEHFWEVDISDKVLPLDVVNNRYERDVKWTGLLNKKDE